MWLLWGVVQLALAADPTPQRSRIPFALATDFDSVTLNGVVDLPKGVSRCVAGISYPALVMIPGTGAFDREVNFGNSRTPQDYLFRELSDSVTENEVAVVRFDSRGLKCDPKSSKDPASCIDLAVRARMTPDLVREDIVRVYQHAQSLKCIDPERVAIFAHSEGTIHVSRLIKDGKIRPNSLVLLGMVATSPLQIVRWQSIDRSLELLGIKDQSQRAAKRVELEREYENFRKSELAKPDTEMKQSFWSYAYWKLWWRDDESPSENLKNYPFGIYAHFADHDGSTPGETEMAAFRKMAVQLKIRPKVVMHKGVGHSLGKDPLVGPMEPEPMKKLVNDLVSAARSEPESEIDWAKVPYFGVLFSPTDDLPLAVRSEASLKSNYGLKLDRVIPSLPAWNAGLRLGDIVLALNGKEVGLLPKGDAAARLSRLARGLTPGGKATFKILRWKTSTEAVRNGSSIAPPEFPSAPGETAKARFNDFFAESLKSDPGKRNELTWKREFQILSVQVPIKLPEAAKVPSHPLRNPEKEISKVEVLARELHRHYGHTKDFEDLLKRFKDATVRPDLFRLPRVNSLQHDPFAIQTSTRELLKRLRSPDAWGQAAKALEVASQESTWEPQPMPELPALQIGISPQEHLRQIRSLLEDAQRAWESSFSKLSKEERSELRENLPLLARKYLEWNYVYQDDDRTRLERNLRVLDLVAKVDPRPLLRAGRSLLRLSDASFVRALEKDLRAGGLNTSDAVVLEESVGQQKIRIAGKGPNDHRRLIEEQVAVLIDLGGDDTYANQVATTNELLNIAVVIDAAGDDLYESSVDFSIGCGLMGLAILADLGGDDRYLGTRFSQGVSLAGVGILLDARGRDEYRAHQFAQGSGFFGVAALVDGDGNDRYEARSHAQALAVGGGLAVLSDHAGDDVYFAKGILPSGYSTPGTYEGWSQGMGVGLRFLASGGLGILLDGGGRDRMEAGDFSQGGGYYYGFGILNARGPESDVYLGNRYAQAQSAHLGIGVLLEEGGNDIYDTRGAVATGISNDRGLSWFEDAGGNDQYAAQHFCGGASANNSISIFEDIKGHDIWKGKHSVANSQVNEYWGGSSLSLVFLNRDAHKTQAREGNTFVFSEGSIPEPTTPWLRSLPPLGLPAEAEP